uniref:Uncharacterized protein n=1 Tax=Romanomermis culicivorax TaxID=13658 RepID=A0A915IUN3_ROMCU
NSPSGPFPANLSIANSWDGFTTYRIIDQQQNHQMSVSATNSIDEKSPKKIFDMYIDLEKSKIYDSNSIFEAEMTPK